MGITNNVLAERYGLQSKKWCQTLIVERNHVCYLLGLQQPTVCIDFVRDETWLEIACYKFAHQHLYGSSSFGNVLLG